MSRRHGWSRPPHVAVAARSQVEVPFVLHILVSTHSGKHNLFQLKISQKMSENPVVFFDIKIGGAMKGRIEIELFADSVPKTTEVSIEVIQLKRKLNLSILTN
jgi:hypothetical protein